MDTEAMVSWCDQRILWNHRGGRLSDDIEAAGERGDVTGMKEEGEIF